MTPHLRISVLGILSYAEYRYMVTTTLASIGTQFFPNSSIWLVHRTYFWGGKGMFSRLFCILPIGYTLWHGRLGELQQNLTRRVETQFQRRNWHLRLLNASNPILRSVDKKILISPWLIQCSEWQDPLPYPFWGHVSCKTSSCLKRILAARSLVSYPLETHPPVCLLTWDCYHFVHFLDL